MTTTLDVIRAGLKSDPTISPADRARLLALIRKGADGPKEETDRDRAIRIIRRAEAARMLSCSTRLIDRLSQAGILRKRYLPNRRRAAGFLESDITAMIS